MSKKYFFFGFGQVAKNFILLQKKEKKKFKFVATSTSKSQIKNFVNKKYQSLKFKNNFFDKKIFRFLNQSDFILVSIPPKKNTDIVLKYFSKILKLNKKAKIIYLSATSVYGNHKGKWVNEKSRLKPTSLFGKRRQKAEKQWLKFHKKFKNNIIIFRLPGIYSKENNALSRLRYGDNVFVKQNKHFFSRIRVEDIATAIQKGFKKNNLGGQIFNISDDLPASNEVVSKFSAKLLKIKSLNPIKVSEIKSKMARDFYKDSKKVSNKKMKSVLKVKLKYPTYKEGLRSLVNNYV